MSALTQCRPQMYLKCTDGWTHIQVMDVGAGGKDWGGPFNQQINADCVPYLRPSTGAVAQW